MGTLSSLHNPAQRPAHQLGILRRMQVPVVEATQIEQLPAADLVVDAVIGYSLTGAPRGAAAALIRWANAHHPSVRATATMTLALPKQGLRAPSVAEAVGELYLADISVPPGLYAGPGLDLSVAPIFARDDIVRLF